MLAQIGIAGNSFFIRCEFIDNERVKGAPEREWDKKTKLWRLPMTPENARYLRQEYDREEFKDNAWTAACELEAQEKVTQLQPFPDDFPFKNPPRPYQKQALDKAYGMKAFGLFMEMRTGKTFVDICLASQYFLEGKIDRWLIVMFPGAIKSTWQMQIEEHMPPEVYERADILLYTPNVAAKAAKMAANTDPERFKVLVVGIESLANGAARDIVVDFAKWGPCKMTVDESTCIKNPKVYTKNKKKTRTAVVWDAGAYSDYRMIMTGTPLTQGVEDLYAQFRFLNWQIIGHKSFFSFRNEHLIMGGFEGRKVIGYRNVNKLVKKLTPYIYQISTKDAIGVPEEVRETLLVEPTPEQARMLKELGDPYEMRTEMEEAELVVETILERMTRYQQIVGGHFPFKSDERWETTPIHGPNPKLEALKGMIETLPKEDKVIIWARFIPEVKQIADTLAEYGDVITFTGGMTDEERIWAQKRFMDPTGPRFWVATQQASARGVELASASIHVFYSCSFSYDDRKQAEMRTSSSHQKAKSILYVDIVMKHDIDRQIYRALQRKQDVADAVLSAIRHYQRTAV